eukprot:Gb_08316 [translate_table: standard]
MSHCTTHAKTIMSLAQLKVAATRFDEHEASTLTLIPLIHCTLLHLVTVRRQLDHPISRVLHRRLSTSGTSITRLFISPRKQQCLVTELTAATSWAKMQSAPGTASKSISPSCIFTAPLSYTSSFPMNPVGISLRMEDPSLLALLASELLAVLSTELLPLLPFALLLVSGAFSVLATGNLPRGNEDGSWKNKSLSSSLSFRKPSS